MSTGTETTPHDDQPDSPPAGEAAAPQAALAGELEAVKREREELFARLQRVSAELDNFQKRVSRERATWTADAQRSILDGILPVLDNIDYALAAFERGGARDPQALHQGVTMVKEELLRQLAAQGIRPVPAEPGSPFDAERHQAISVQEVPGIESEQVALLARPGYLHGERLIRPAQVVVKKPAAPQG